MGAAIDRAIGLDAVPHDFAAAVGTLGRQGVDGALERVEGVALAVHFHGEGLVIVVAAQFSLRHDLFSLSGQQLHAVRERKK